METLSNKSCANYCKDGDPKNGVINVTDNKKQTLIFYIVAIEHQSTFKAKKQYAFDITLRTTKSISKAAELGKSNANA